ncbi:hypothetical protein T4D_7031 [Trichinella pseudospiralis]|uniref:Uncharacterized protein n=1 Tax=Trichinella pseudospiralis TaxID=6337 RepID=A0A0V1FW67_TRIPS|nr:hypothetical protein T4D_7031 [Trichinella pseudospiralis]
MYLMGLHVWLSYEYFRPIIYSQLKEPSIIMAQQWCTFQHDFRVLKRENSYPDCVINMKIFSLTPGSKGFISLSSLIVAQMCRSEKIICSPTSRTVENSVIPRRIYFHPLADIQACLFDLPLLDDEVQLGQILMSDTNF